jgi:hypothetical protein
VTRNSKYLHNSAATLPVRQPVALVFWILELEGSRCLIHNVLLIQAIISCVTLFALWIYLFSCQVHGPSYLTSLWFVQHFNSHTYFHENLWIAYRNFNMCCMWCKMPIHIVLRELKINCVQCWKITCDILFYINMYVSWGWHIKCRNMSGQWWI